MLYSNIGQHCPNCGHRFKVLADEAGSHSCPKCNFHPELFDFREDEWGEEREHED